MDKGYGYGEPLVIRKRPRIYPRGMAYANRYSTAGRNLASYARNVAASTIQRAFRKNRARGRFGQRVRVGPATTLARPTRIGFETQEGANSITKCNFGYQKPYVPQHVLRSLAVQVFDYNYAYEASTSIGLQDYTQINWLDPTIINSLTATNDQNVFCSLEGEMSIVNSSSSNSVLTFYDIICRKDCSVVNIATPGAAWSYGVDIQGGSATDYKNLGSRPDESIAFNQFYKIVQKTPITLAPGQLHRHRVTWSPNKLIQGQYSTQVAYGLQGFTCFTMIVHHGMPAHDSTTVTSVTIDVSDLDIVWKESIKFKQLDKSTGAWTKTNNLATTFAVGEQFVNEAVGQVQDAAGLHPGTLHA